MAIDVGKFLKAPEYEIKITTYRDIFQIEALENDRFGGEYKKFSACIMMSKEDMKKMRFKSGDRVKLTNSNGSVVVEVKETKRDEPAGLAFMVNSPWSNVLVPCDAGGKGVPEFKNISARISLTKEEVTTLESLIKSFLKP